MLPDLCWAIAVTKEHLSEFLQREGFKRRAVEIYGEMERLRILDRFFDRRCALRRKAMGTTSRCSMMGRLGLWPAILIIRYGRPSPASFVGICRRCLLT